MTARRAAAALVVALVLAATAAACSDDGGDPSSTTPTTAPPTEGAQGILTNVAARLSNQITIAGVLEVEAAEPVHLQVTATAGDEVVEVPETAQARRRHRIPVVGLHEETTYTLAVRALDDQGTEVDTAETELATGALPEWVPAITLNGNDVDRMSPGVTLFDIQRWGVTPPEDEPPGMLVALDEQGEVVWYLGNGLGAGDSRMGQDGSIWFLFAPFGFKQVDLLGNRIQSWAWGGPEDVRPGGPTIVDSERYDLTSFHHEVAPQPDGNIIVFSRYDLDLTDAEQEAICPGDPVDFGIREDLVMEITRDGDIVNEWSLHDVIDPAQVPGRELCAVDFEDYRDWAHGNGIVLDRENNQVIVSARHIDQLFAFRYADDAGGPSGELLWSVGPNGTLPLTGGEQSYGIHAPELQDDGTILLFDNGNERPGGELYSRLVRLEIGADGARQLWEFRTDDLRTGEPLYADFLGDADQLPNGNVLGGFGGIGQEVPPARGRIIEVVPTGSEGGDIVWDVSLPDTYTSYRAERLPSLYAGPRWQTDVVVPLVS